MGVDDVEYAAWLPVPLTTMRQPVRRLAKRRSRRCWSAWPIPIARPATSSSSATLVVRQSCGAGRELGRDASPRRPCRGWPARRAAQPTRSLRELSRQQRVQFLGLDLPPVLIQLERLGVLHLRAACLAVARDQLRAILVGAPTPASPSRSPRCRPCDRRRPSACSAACAPATSPRRRTATASRRCTANFFSATASMSTTTSGTNGFGTLKLSAELQVDRIARASAACRARRTAPARRRRCRSAGRRRSDGRGDSRTGDGR